MKLAIVGVTGLVGTVLLEVLEEFKLPLTDIIPVASKNSEGKEIKILGKTYKIVSLDSAIKMKPNIAIFSAGSAVSLEWAPKFKKAGAKVIDNSSAWRMDKTKKLIIPEINIDKLKPTDSIIANPNCSTIQMLVPLAPLHKKYEIKRIVVSTYQSVSGTGIAALNQLEDEKNNIDNVRKVYPYRIYKNALPQCDVFEENGYTKEEMKMVRETKKILDPKIKLTATAVRIPVQGGHSESVNVQFKKDFDIDEVKDIISKAKGVKLVDNPSKQEYPMCIDSEGKNDVFVGRIRRDETVKNALNMWIVADNLRKGAATNTVQIAEYLIKNKLV